MVFVHGGKKLAGYKEVGYLSPEPIEVRLEAWGVVTGRLVDSAGLPARNFGMQPHLISRIACVTRKFPTGKNASLPTRPAGSGWKALCLGESYRLVYENASGSQTEAGLQCRTLEARRNPRPR